MTYPRVQYISQGRSSEEQKRHVEDVLKAGVRWIQLRCKDIPDKAELFALAKDIRALCQRSGAVCIINDHVDIALAVGADGVHLGLKDMPIPDARKILGDQKIIGGTANTFDDVRQRMQEGCNYIGLGPLRYTATKAGLSPLLGVAGYRAIMAGLKEARKVPPPVYAIGGIVSGDLEALLSADVYGVAISGLLTDDPERFRTLQQYIPEAGLQ